MELSVVIACKNEVATIGELLRDLADQSFPKPFEVMIADGLSDDGTREVLARFQALDMPYDLRVVDNPSGTIPDAWNTAVAEARGKYIIPLGSHSRLPGDYLESLVNALREPGRDVVGPTTRIIPGADTRLAREIALALNTILGTGGTLARGNLREPTRVDHAPWHCYSRELWEAIGGYDENLLTNEDFDFDYRANLQGFGVWSLPYPQVTIVARASLRRLVRQRFRYGYWKWQVVKRHPRSLRLRQLLPVFVTAGVVTSTVLGFRRPKLLLLPFAYGLFLCLYSANLSMHESSRPRWWRLAIIYATTHLAWGSGFLWGLVTQPRDISHKIEALRSSS